MTVVYCRGMPASHCCLLHPLFHQQASALSSILPSLSSLSALLKRVVQGEGAITLRYYTSNSNKQLHSCKVIRGALRALQPQDASNYEPRHPRSYPYVVNIFAQAAPAACSSCRPRHPKPFWGCREPLIRHRCSSTTYCRRSVRDHMHADDASAPAVGRGGQDAGQTCDWFSSLMC